MCQVAPEVAEKLNASSFSSFNKKDYGLFPVRADTFGPLVFVNISGDAPPLEEYLGEVCSISCLLNICWQPADGALYSVPRAAGPC